jgi:hypothetical protein
MFLSERSQVSLFGSDKVEEKKPSLQQQVKYEERGIFGVNLLAEGGLDRAITFIDKCQSFILRYGLYQEGVFRLCGSKPNIEELKHKIDNDPDDFQFDDTPSILHNVTGVFKLFFREMPDPLMTFELYFAFIGAAAGAHEGRKQTIRTVINLLPPENLFILEKICRFLHQIHEHAHSNKMSAANLGTCIGFTLLRPEVDDPATIISDAKLACELFKSLIEDPDAYFCEWDDTVVEPEPEPDIFVSPKGSSSAIKNNPTLFRNLSTGSSPPERTVLRPTSLILGNSNEAKKRKKKQLSMQQSLPPLKEREEVTNPLLLQSPEFMEMGTNTHSNTDSNKPPPLPPPPTRKHGRILTPENQKRLPASAEKIQEVKNQFLKDYEMHRSMSYENMENYKAQAQMNDEQFKENLESIAKKVQDGEMDDIGLKSKDKEESQDQNVIISILFTPNKPKRQSHREKSNDRPDVKRSSGFKLDLTKISFTGSNDSTASPKQTPQKSTRKTKPPTTPTTLELFGKRTSEQMEKLFKKTNARELGGLSLATPRRVRKVTKVEAHLEKGNENIN